MTLQEWLERPEYRRHEADLLPAPPTHGYAGPGLNTLPCAFCGGEGRLFHEGILKPEPCPECRGTGRQLWGEEQED